MKKEIQKFDKFIKKETKNELTAFDETIEIFIELMNPTISANQQNLIDRMGEYIAFDNVDKIQSFFDNYFGYQNKMIEHMERSLMLSKDKDFVSFMGEWAKNILQTIPKEDRVIDVVDSVYYLHESVAEMYDIGLIENPENIRDDMLRAFRSEEVSDMFTLMIVVAYEISESEDVDEDELQRLVELMISFSIAMNEIRKQRHEEKQNTKSLQNSFGGVVNSPSYNVGRNDACPCGSGKKYKKCCLNKKATPFESLQSSEPTPPHALLSNTEVTEFYAVWSRFMAFVGHEYCDMNNQRYKVIYEKDKKGKFLLKESAVKDSYYLKLRVFLVDNFQELVANYISSKKVSTYNIVILNNLKTKHIHSDFYAMEKFSNGNAIFWDSKNDQCYYVYRGYDKLSRLLSPDNTPFEALLLSYEGRIICDGVMGHYNMSVGEGMQSLIVESYEKTRENLKFDLDEVKEMEKEIYQLKISIKGAKPPVWRRVLVESSASFYTLHNIIQTLFEWMDCHLHEFKALGSRYTDKESLEDSFSWGGGIKDESFFSIDHELVNEKDKIDYVYDFGDDWRHTIVLEKILPFEKDKQYPVCTGGRGDAFGEDSGGTYQDGADEALMDTEPFDKDKINRMFGIVK
ncbi:MAG: SEC-C domain-containing protein [Epsilonproteobacteria bacterium]|nr:SEC-C domain-containing protein [Campylobacterota bacterium]